MSDDAKKLDDQLPIPTLELWTLIKKYPLPKTDDGAPAPGTERLHAAHSVASEWLARVELELGCPSFENSSDWAEFDLLRRRYGLCPKCGRNDDYLMVGSPDDPQYWSLCHRHRVRWELDPEVLNDSFRVFGWDAWEDPFRPVWKYAVLQPIYPEGCPAAEETDHGPDQNEPLPPNSARPQLRLVTSEERQHEQDLGPQERWPPCGRVSFVDHALRLVCGVYFVAVVLPRELVTDAWEYFAPEVG